MLEAVVLKMIVAPTKATKALDSQNLLNFAFEHFIVAFDYHLTDL